MNPHPTTRAGNLTLGRERKPQTNPIHLTHVLPPSLTHDNINKRVLPMGLTQNNITKWASLTIKSYTSLNIDIALTTLVPTQGADKQKWRAWINPSKRCDTPTILQSPPQRPTSSKWMLWARSYSYNYKIPIVNFHKFHIQNLCLKTLIIRLTSWQVITNLLLPLT